MKNMRKLVTGLAVTGLLAGGAAPAIAQGGHDSAESKTIKVLVVREHKKSGHLRDVEHKTLTHKKAAQYAAEQCGGKWWEYVHKVKKAEDSNKPSKKFHVCKYDHKKNKNVEFHVYFHDDDHGKGGGHKDGDGKKRH